jgi:hypothetical protein
MVISNNTASVEIELRELGPVGTPAEGDLGFTVAATAAANGVGGAFAGTNSSVGLGRD